MRADACTENKPKSMVGLVIYTPSRDAVEIDTPLPCNGRNRTRPLGAPRKGHHVKQGRGGGGAERLLRRFRFRLAIVCWEVGGR